MITKYSPLGNFEDFLPHELLVDLIRAEFSGSIEIRFADGSRTIRFSKGQVAGTSSTYHQEQIDKIIERTISADLEDDQREELLELAQQGMKYSQAVVEAGVLSATELLRYNDEQAKIICKNALQDQAQKYDMREETTAQMRPLSVDLLDFIYRSLINDVPDDKIIDQLGADEQTIFMPSDVRKITSPEIQQNQELATILNHLDGKRTVEELRRKVGFNPERTSRILLFLRMIHWIEPAIGDSSDFAEDPLEIASVATGAYRDESSSGSKEVDDPLLKMVDEQGEGLEVDVSGVAPDQRNIESQGDDVDNTLNKPVDFGSMLAGEQQEKTRLSFSWLKRWYVLAAVAVLILAGAALIVWPLLIENGSSNEGAAETDTSPPAASSQVEEDPGELSFYGENDDTSQLPVDEDFTKERPDRETSIKIPVTEETGRQNDSPSGANGKVAAEEARESETESQPVEDQPAQTERRPETARPRPPAEPLAAIHDRALRQAVTGRWQEATSLWRSSLRNYHLDDYTLLFPRGQLAEQDSMASEQFANNEYMRGEVLILKGSGGGLIFAWGIFKDIDSARAALDELPAKFRAFGPSIYRVRDLLRR